MSMAWSIRTFHGAAGSIDASMVASICVVASRTRATKQASLSSKHS
jgi:hypothetical protein